MQGGGRLLYTDDHPGAPQVIHKILVIVLRTKQLDHL